MVLHDFTSAGSLNEHLDISSIVTISSQAAYNTFKANNMTETSQGTVITGLGAGNQILLEGRSLVSITYDDFSGW